MAVYVMFLCDVACQKLLNSANVSRSYSQNNTGTVFLRHGVLGNVKRIADLNHIFAISVTLLIRTGGCFHRSSWRWPVWNVDANTSLRWTSRLSTTAATNSRTRVGSWLERLIQRCPSVCTFTRILRQPANSGWANLSLSTNWNSPTTSPTNTDLLVTSRFYPAMLAQSAVMRQ